MTNTLYMDKELFDTWTDNLIIKSYNWQQIGISNDYCNQISEPEYGLRIINWQDREFEIIDVHKYTVFLLRYR
jgi:hypothetical protein